MKKYLDKLYVAYGSNLNKDQMKKRCPDAVPIVEAILYGYKLKFMGNARQYGVLNIVKDEDSSVPIVLWKITKEDEKSLDLYEGYPFLYKKRYFSCNINEEKYECMAYVMTNSYNKPALPTSYYYDIVAAGYKDFKFTTATLKNVLRETQNEVMMRGEGEEVAI